MIFAGRFMRFKRLQLLIEAHHLMRITTDTDSVLVVAGGFPGEWEGEHPYDTVQRLGAQGVFFTGWHDHDELAEMLTCSDVFAAPSVDEPFGLVYLEAMAAGLPPIATTTGGPMAFINVDHRRPTGWLVPPDDVDATARALTAAVADPAARSQRGRRAARFVREHYSWQSSAQAFTDLYGEVIDDHPSNRHAQPGGTMSGSRVRDDGAGAVVRQQVHDQLISADLGPDRVVRRHTPRHRRVEREWNFALDGQVVDAQEAQPAQPAGPRRQADLGHARRTAGARSRATDSPGGRRRTTG